MIKYLKKLFRNEFQLYVVPDTVDGLTSMNPTYNLYKIIYSQYVHNTYQHEYVDMLTYDQWVDMWKYLLIAKQVTHLHPTDLIQTWYKVYMDKELTYEQAENIYNHI